MCGNKVIAMRIGAYDGLFPFLRAIDWMSGGPMRPLVEWMNAGFNMGFAIAAWRVLTGLHASLPEDERSKYNWLTCAFYPARMNFHRRTGL